MEMETDDSLDRAGEPQSDRRWEEEEADLKGKLQIQRKRKREGKWQGEMVTEGKILGQPVAASDKLTDCDRDRQWDDWHAVFMSDVLWRKIGLNDD